MRTLALSSLLVLAACAPKAETPVQASPARWDFSKARTSSYTYTQHSSFESNLDGFHDTHVGDVTGALDVVSEGKGVANVVMRIQKAQMHMADAGARDIPATQIVVPDMREDGTIDHDTAQSMALMMLLAPLPRRALRVNESEDVPMSFPFNAGGSPLKVNGSVRLTLTSNATVEGHQLATYDAVFAVDKLTIPKQMTGKYSCGMTGQGVVRFDVGDHSLASAKLDVTMKMSIDEGPRGSMNMASISTSETSLTRR